MTSNSSGSQPMILVFKGENYEFWSLKMRTLRLSQNLWGFVEKGYTVITLENRNNHSNALFFIQQAIDDSIFSHIIATKKAKKAWALCRGNTKRVHRDLLNFKLFIINLKNMFIKENENIQVYFFKVLEIVTWMHSHGEDIKDQGS